MKMFMLYLRERSRVIAMILTLVLLLVVVTVLYSIPLTMFSYIIELYIVILLCVVIYDFLKFRKKSINLSTIIESANVMDIADIDATGHLEGKYLELAEKLYKEKQKLIETQTGTMTDMKDYYAMWAHQIKTPIAALNLLLQIDSKNIMQTDITDMKQEIFKIDFYVDSVMNYLRLDDMSSDFTFKKYSVEKMIKASVKKFAPQFIGRHISVSIGDVNNSIYTDEKWYSFIAEQLISNAIKYTNDGGKVSIYMDEKSTDYKNILVIEDDGIGIAPEDIPRIMERGFTGYNGRIGKKSSGIGLYLCRKAADKLGVEISFESNLSKGTRVYVTVEQKTLTHE